MSIDSGEYAYVVLNDEGKVIAAALARLCINPKDEGRNYTAPVYESGSTRIAVVASFAMFREGSSDCRVWRTWHTTGYFEAGGHPYGATSGPGGMVIYNAAAAYAVLGLVLKAKEVIVVSAEQARDLDPRAMCLMFHEEAQRLYRFDLRLLIRDKQTTLADRLVQAIIQEERWFKECLDQLDG